MTNEDVTRALTDIIKNSRFERAVGLSNNGDKSSLHQGERRYPTRPSFSLGRGMTSRKRNGGSYSETEEDAGFQRRDQAKRARHRDPTRKSGDGQLDCLVVEASTDDSPSRAVYHQHRRTADTGVRFQERFRPEPSAPSLDVLQNRGISRGRQHSFVPVFDVRDGSDDEYGGNPVPGSGEGGV